jgi:hypothetical protein
MAHQNDAVFFFSISTVYSFLHCIYSRTFYTLTTPEQTETDLQCRAFLLSLSLSISFSVPCIFYVMYSILACMFSSPLPLNPTSGYCSPRLSSLVVLSGSSASCISYQHLHTGKSSATALTIMQAVLVKTYYVSDRRVWSSRPTCSSAPTLISRTLFTVIEALHCTAYTFGI